MAYDPSNPHRGPLSITATEGSFQPHVEVVTHPPGDSPAANRPWYRAHRMRVFLAVFLILSIPGLAWDFLRPAQYRASAALLTEAVPLGDEMTRRPGADAQHVAIQERVLLGQDLLEAVLQTAADRSRLNIRSADELRSMLEVSPTPDTHVVAIAATGPEPDQLAVVVNAWIDAYQEKRRQAVEDEVGETRRALQEESDSLAATIAARREALESFRAENDIVTMERDGNEALARLRALNQDLNRARDEAVEAEARRDAILAAIARGDPVVPRSEQGNLDHLESRASELRARLIELEKRFTPLYLENEPDIRVIPAQLEELEAEIAAKVAHGRQVMTAKADQEVEQARQRVEVLEQDLARQKDVAGRFTAGFAEYEALQNDLTKLEEMHRKAESDLVEVQARGLADFPAVDVIEPAHPPTTPFHPEYWRDALFILLGSLLVAFCAVLLLEFLTRRPREDREPAPVMGVRVYAGAGGLPLPEREVAAALQHADPTPSISGSRVASLPSVSPRELIPAEVGALWQLADPLSRQLMALLLSGLSLEECAALDAGCFDMDARVLRVPADPPRELPLTETLADLFIASRPLPLWAGSDLHQTPDDLSARIGLLAHDAGLSQPHEVTAEALRHSYIAVLVRRGARLTEISRIIGAMPPSALARYAALAPAGPARSLAEVDLIYPVLKSPKRQDSSAPA
jgi:succinoglycan biosynthesis transport protein ExoP